MVEQWNDGILGENFVMRKRESGFRISAWADSGMTELRPLPRGLGQLLKINFAGGAKPHPYEDLITAQKSRGGV